MTGTKRNALILAAALLVFLAAAACGRAQKEETAAAGPETVTEAEPSGELTSETEEESEEAASSPDAETVSETETPALSGEETGSGTDASGTSSEALTESETETETEPETTTAGPKNGLVWGNGGLYYYRSDQPQTGWQTLGGNRYYFQADGRAAVGRTVIGGNTYYFDANGVMKTGFQFIGGKRYYFQSNGVMLRNTTLDRYVIDGNGVCTDRFGKISASNLAEYTDFLLAKNGRSLKGAYDYIWKNYVYRYAPRIGTLEGLTEANRIAMICRFLNNGYGPCTDFAYTLQYFCQRLGYQARVVTGEGMNHDEHDWVLVQVSPGTWRHMDALYKTQYLYLLTDAQLARFDGDTYRFRWDRTKWTSTTASGTGGRNPDGSSTEEPTPAATTAALPEPTAAPTTEEAATTAPEPTTAPPETTAAPPETTTAPPETTAAPTTEETTAAPPTTAETTTQAPTEAPTTAPEPATTTVTEAPTEAPEPPAETPGGAAASGESLLADGE